MNELINLINSDPIIKQCVVSISALAITLVFAYVFVNMGGKIEARQDGKGFFDN